jgi:hypothetical protein
MGAMGEGFSRLPAESDARLKPEASWAVEKSARIVALQQNRRIFKAR